MILHIVPSDHPLRCKVAELFTEAEREDSLGGRELTVCVTEFLARRIVRDPILAQINGRVSEIVRLDGNEKGGGK